MNVVFASGRGSVLMTDLDWPTFFMGLFALIILAVFVIALHTPPKDDDK